MKHTNLAVQNDMFDGVPAPPALSNLETNHDQLVSLLSRLLWEVVLNPPQTIAESAHEQDQR